ncbi:penicillin-binding protein activator [Ferrimonas senticii]|uniref:penicillin-binding protein activator n=1 Tax=Ferrimonas senticii TaxID=394566 RepID=UPI000414E9C7|nr:penicillin-binding protein activator [Ferrimonas senticii]
MKSLYLSSFKQTAVGLLMATLVGCASAPQSVEPVLPPVALGVASDTPTQYLQLADASSGERRLSFLLLAARSYLNEGQPQPARELLNRIQAMLPSSGTLAAESRLLTAKLALQDGNPQGALSLLQWPSGWSLPAAQWRDALQTEIAAHQQLADPINVAFGHHRLSDYLAPQQQQGNWDSLWQALVQVDTEQLLSLQTQSQDPQWLGWLQLASIAQQYSMDPTTMLQQLAAWQQTHPAHPAARKLPASLDRTINVQPYQPSKVAVLLPLTGKVQSQARALQDGLLANLLSQASNRQVQFIDTNVIDAAEAYQQALDQGAEFVIGPLLKGNLDKVLAVYDGEVPLLALNHSDLASSHQNLYFFALTPEAEAQQAAQRIAEQGLKQPLVLASSNSIGKRMAEAFVEQWQQDGDAVEIHYFGQSAQMRQSVQQALHVDQSNQRISRIKQLFGSNTQADFRSRRDIDSVYLVASAEEVRLLKPFVDVSLAVFAEPLAQYSSSRAHGSLDDANLAEELRGLNLSEMPWLLSDNSQRQQVQQLWPDRPLPLQRLYAMGYDSWSLIDRLAQMRAFAGYPTVGLSGELVVAADGQLSRRLSWSQYQRNGLVIVE